MNPSFLAPLLAQVAVSAPPPPHPSAAAVDAAFGALKTYDQGSSRATLLAIDEAVVSSLLDANARRALELRMVSAIKHAGSVVAREYLCSKLTLIGSELCVPALGALLDQPSLSTAARNALEASPHPQASQALRARLPQLQGELQAGVIQSIGVRRDPDSVPALARLLTAGAEPVSSAAAAALGEIGSAAAARALRDFQPRAPAALRPAVADACLVCAERLRDAGYHAEAESLLRLLDTAVQPKHVRQAAARGVK